MPKPLAVLALGLLTSVGLAACGGSSNNQTPGSASITSTAALDGWVTGGGAFDAMGGGAAVGDTSGNDQGVQIFSFSLAGIPAGATITDAVLRIRQHDQLGTPYGTLGDVVVDHFDMGPDLDAADYAGGTILAGFGTLSTDTTQEYKEIGVAARVQADITAGRTKSDFRVRFAVVTDNDNGFDVTRFENGDNEYSTGDLPILEVTWLAP